MYRRKFYLKVLLILISWLILPDSMKLLAHSYPGSNLHSEMPKSNVTENYQDGSSAIYYISTDGDDNNSGLSPDQAWKTIEKVNTSTFIPGDRILFKRGEEWRETLVVSSSGSSSGYITYGTYGTADAKPIINGANIVTGWTNYSSNVWAADCPTVIGYGGWNYGYMVIIDNVMYTQVETLGEVNNPNTFFINTSSTPDKIYVYLTVDPDLKKAEVSARNFGIIIHRKAYIKIEGLNLRNAAHSGMFFYGDANGQFSGFSLVESCNFYQNRITGVAFCDGYSNSIVQNSTSEYNGNGFYSLSNLGTYGSDNNIFRKCVSRHNICYRVGTWTDGHGFGIFDSDGCIVEFSESEDDTGGIVCDANGNKNDVTYRYNYIHDTKANTSGLGIGQSIPSGTVHLAYGNLIVNTGVGGDSYGINVGRYRDGQVYLFNNTIYQDGDIKHSGGGIKMASSTNVKMQNNIIYSNSDDTHILVIVGDAGFASDYNLFYSPNDPTNIFSLNGINYHTLIAWQSISSQDANSIYGNPLFINEASNWMLQPGSPAINAGINVGLTSDIMGNPVIGLPDIGAFEAQADPVTPIPTYLLSKVENIAPSILEMNYNMTLANIVPAASSFAVRVNSVIRTVSSVAISGTKVLLTLPSPIVYGDVVTVAYTKPSASALQTSEGGQAVTISAQPVTNNVAAAPVPVYTSSVIENSTPSRLEITYSLSLANIVPAASAFTVHVNSASRAVSSVAVSGTKVILSLASPVASGNVVTIAYTKPAANPLQTAAGGQAATITAQAVTNNVAAAPVPVYTGSVIENSTPSRLEMTYSLSLANIVPAASAFAVLVNSTARTVSSVAVSGTKVILTLASPVASGNVVTVAYTKPSANSLQTAAGGQAASISAQAVTNNVAAAPVPVPVYTSSAIENSTPSRLEITYSLSLANIVPAASAFTVLVNSASRAVSSVTISGTKVILTLASPVASGNVVTVAYTKPSSNPLQTAAGGQAASISAQTVTNNIAAAQIPVYVSSAIENSTPSRLEMTYSLSLANIVPAASAFTVMVNSASRAVSSVAVSGTRVILTLAGLVASGNVVTVAYSKPSANPLQTAAGGQAASFSTQTTTNKVIVINAAPVVVVRTPQNCYSGFVNEISASGSYDPDKDGLTFTWSAPSSVPISSSSGATIKFLGPIVYEPQPVEFTLSVSDGKTTLLKVVSVEILPYNPGLEVAEVMSLEASSYQPPNYPHNIIDGNSNTMWSSFGEDQWLLVELKQLFSIQYVILAFRPDQRGESYFDIFGSDDKVTWEPILTKSTSCGFSGDLQAFEFPPLKAGKEFKFVKLICQGSSTDSWNYVSEFKIFGFKNTNTTSYADQPVKIYPNPAHESLNIRIDKTALNPDFIRITDLLGKVLLQVNVNQDIEIIQLPIKLANGIYLIQIGSGNNSMFSQKIIVSN